MRHEFPREEYKEICGQLKPSKRSVREVKQMTRTKKRGFRRKAFAAAAAGLVLTFSVPAAAMAAADGEAFHMLKEAAGQLAAEIRKLTISEEESTADKTVAYGEDGRRVTMVHGYGENGENYVSLIYHADSETLGVLVGDIETDITGELEEKGSYTQEYVFEGKSYRLLVTGTPKEPVLETEALE